MEIISENQIEILKNVKSKHVLDKIFSFLDEKKKLKLIIYNKYLQKSLDINLENYKKVSGIYKIDGINGKGKEYAFNANRLIFYGEYLNGKRNGKWEEYYNSNINYKCFEGEYLNGKRNGKGKEYYKKNKLKFEGEYLNGKKNGKGKEYSEDGKLTYDGEFLNGKKNGKGKEYNNGLLLFEGEYLNNKKWNGKLYNPYRKKIIFKKNIWIEKWQWKYKRIL